MPTPGIGDPYWFEWYVGIENIINMLNPDSGIDYVTFQCEAYNTIDDVVVGYKNGTQEICYQVKHEIATSSKTNLTFGKLLEKAKDSKQCLISAMATGWKDANSSSDCSIIPVLFTNRNLGKNKSKRTFDKKPYTSYPLDTYFPMLQEVLNNNQDITNLNFEDKDLETQWKEMCHAIDIYDIPVVSEFIMAFKLCGNALDLEKAEEKMIKSLAQTFACSELLASELFKKLIAELRIWTTTRRTDERIYIEDVYTVLGTEADIDSSQHRLAPPYPFFNSRRLFCTELEQTLRVTNKKVVFVTGDPGSGKTSIVSHIQAVSNIFLLRYHTFKPISPEQRFYNLDEGMCTQENLWGGMLVQLRCHFRGKLAQYNVPLNNQFCTTEELRKQVHRLLALLGKDAIENNKKVFVCIDGIDHAARTKNSPSFLSSLFLPEEVPDGVCFVIVGQPVDMYQFQYPAWLHMSNTVEQIEVPKLCVDDIKQLILNRAPQFVDEIESVSQLIAQYTDGNNLSAVFAVEELCLLTSIEDAVEKIEHCGICSDIQQYYEHIWSYVNKKLVSMGLGIPFPEVVVACSVLLMNGRISTRILSQALPYKLSEGDWNQILSNLYPLIVKCGDSTEFSLFHNDFRVFLMGIVSGYKAKYREIALQLAEYLHNNDESILAYVSCIPLLRCAERKDLIPSYFTTPFVIGALSEGVSKQRMEEYAKLSYEEACYAKNEDLFRSTYLSIKTLYQHEQYYEYYSRTYASTDYLETASVDISEIRTIPITQENLDEYSRVLELCLKLRSSNNPEYISRSTILYCKWFENLTSSDFLHLCEADITEEKAWKLRKSKVGIFLQQWGSTAAAMQIELITIVPSSNKEYMAKLSFGDAYFDKCFEQKEYSYAIEALEKNYVSSDCFEKKIEVILYENLGKLFSRYLSKVAEKSKVLSTKLLASSILTISTLDIPISMEFMSDFEPIEHICDESTFSIVLSAFLIGSCECSFDEAVICGHAKSVYKSLEGKENELNQIAKMVTLACLLGKHHLQPTAMFSNTLKRHIKWFLTTNLWRRFDYTRAHRFLLLAIPRTSVSRTLAFHSDLMDDLVFSLFEVDFLGMHYKTHILDFLVEHKYLETIERYILQLYGENGDNIFLNENCIEMHYAFCPYGEIVLPQIMKTVSDKLKWDVVAYVGHKEYAMQGPSECFEVLTTIDPSLWKDCGKRLYRQSLIANISNNQYAYDIQNNLVKAAIRSGLNDYWELHYWDDSFKMNPDLLYHSLFEFIETAKTSEDFISIWILSCGIHSWYTREGRIGSKCVFEACKKKAAILGIEFPTIVSKLTPEWLTIIHHESINSEYQPKEDEYNKKIQEKKAEIRNEYMLMGIEELLQELQVIANIQHVEERFCIIIEKLKIEQQLNYDNGKKVLLSLCNYLRSNSWNFLWVEELIKILLNLLGKEAFWSFAEIMGEYLSEYSYHTSTSNLQILIKLYCYTDVDKVRVLFEDELSTQETWITGNNHISINDEFHPISSKTNAPSSYSKMVFYLLVEQIETKNGRKIESALYGIYKLGNVFPATLEELAMFWSTLSEFQKEILLPVISRWCVDRADGFSYLYETLTREYEVCNSLDRKYYLHSILNLYNQGDYNSEQIEFNALPEDYNLPLEGALSDGGLAKRFLNFSEVWYDSTHMNDDIRKYAGQLSLEKGYVEDQFSDRGDCTIPPTDVRITQVLYGIEKNGRWDKIPLISKKCWLLYADDPFMITEMPTIVYNDEWFPVIHSITKDDKATKVIDEKDLSKIVHMNCSDSEQVLGACLWYPWDYNDGVMYYEIAKVDAGGISLTRSSDVEWCLGNFGLLYQEGHIDEMGSRSAYGQGVSLFKLVGGGMRFCHGNCQIAPSGIWKDAFSCKPDNESPYRWTSESGDPVLRFERITSPIREVMHENYYRQPVLFRWICNSEWLKSMLDNTGLRIRYVSSAQPIS